MTVLESRIRAARNILTVNHWLNQLCLTTILAAVAFGVVALVARLYDLDAPLSTIGAVAAGASLLVSAVWAWCTRVDPANAAAALDEAAGLRERISSGLFCQTDADPFAQAVLADAEQAGAHLTVRRHLRYARPKRLSGAGLAVVVAAGMLLVPPGLLVEADTATENNAVEIRRVASVAKKRTEHIRKTARTNPALRDLVNDLEKLEQAPEVPYKNAADVRRNALKTLDKMKDALGKQKSGRRFEQVKQFKKMLRSLKTPDRRDTPMSRLSKALARGDFKQAKEQLNALKEQLAKLSTPADKERMKALQAQLDRLAKQLEKAADNKKLQQQLAQAGLSEKEIKKLLQNLTKKDIEQLKKRLQQQGMSQQQINKLTQQCKSCSAAGALAKQLGQAISRAAGAGSNVDAMDGLQQASDQLSAMEMLEQEMNQIDSLMADVQDAKNDLANPCSSCNGTGRVGNGKCGACNGSGNRGMGRRMGRGRGGIAPEERTGAVGFVKRRSKVKSGRGAIIGQFLIDGEQVRGNVSSEISELLDASERDAADAVNRARIPRRYHKAVRNYFSDLQKALENRSSNDDPPPEANDDQPKPDDD